MLSPFPQRSSITLAVLGALNFTVPLCAQAADGTATEPGLSAVVVQGSGPQQATEKSSSYTVKKSNAATGLDLTPAETPQSISVVTRAQMDDFKSSTANAVLDGVTGVTVQRYEEDRTYYTARGFDITNFQVDGLGMPMAFGLFEGDMDTAIYDRIEVVRGANGLMSSTGNPSATVNYVRKRPTKDFQASSSISYGSWNTKRVTGDISGSLVESGKIRGRLVAGGQDGDSYLDRYHKRKTYLSAILEADVGEASVLSAGYSYQNNRPTGTMWGGLPMTWSDGTQTDLDRSTSTAASWSYWTTKTQSAFIEGKHVFDNGWQASTSLTRRESHQDSNLLYAYGSPDRSTGLGLYSYPSLYTMDSSQNQLDARASGPFALFGRQHELLFGAGYARANIREYSGYGNDIGTALSSIYNWSGNYPQPDYSASSASSNYWLRQRNLYAATKLQVADKLKLILGANNTRITSDGDNYGMDYGRADSATSPYAGLLYALTPSVTAYSSFTSIFTAQNQQSTSGGRLAPATGYSTEGGLKYGTADGRLNASVAVFRVRQDNLAEFAETVNLRDLYTGIDTYAQGYELEAAGLVLPGLQLSAGYTAQSIRDSAGRVARTYMPAHTLKTAARWQINEAIKVGAGLRWQGDTHNDLSSSSVIRQDDYLLIDLMAGYAFNKKLSADLNIYNLTDKKYLNSVRWSQNYYGAPRSAMVTLSWKY